MKKMLVWMWILAGVAPAQPICQPGPTGPDKCVDTTTYPDPDLCYEKLKFDSSRDPQWCRNFKSTADSSFFLIEILLKGWGPVEARYDSAHMAWLYKTGETLFTKYDIRYYKDSTRAVWPLQGEGYSVSYSYSMLMTKATAMALKEEPDVIFLYEWHLVTIPVRRSISPRRPGAGEAKAGVRGFDARGKEWRLRPGSSTVLFPFQ